MDLASAPLPPGMEPVFGHARAFSRNRLAYMVNTARDYPEGARMRFFGQDVLVVSSPAAAHDVLVDKARAFEKAPALRIVLFPLAGTGLFTAEGDLWKRQRRLMAPLFQPSAIAQYVNVVTGVVARAAASWRPGEAIDLGREMTRITMAVVGKALFDSDAFDEADELGEALTVALAWANDSFDSRWLALQLTVRTLLESAEGRVSGRLERGRRSILHALSAPAFIPSSHGPRLRRAIGRLDDKIRRMIDERRAAGRGAKDDFLARLLRARDEDGSKMDDRQVRDEAVTLFVAGHETTATALTWAFYRLSREPELLARLTAEADAITSDADYRDPSKLSFSLRVFKEAMRLYPPVYIFSRRALEPVTACGFNLPKGSLVLVSPYCVHRRTEVYPDPERFDPDRFTPAADAARPRSSYLPFGAGPRICVGNHFALMEGPIVLAALARRLSLLIPPGPLVEPGTFATLRPGRSIEATVMPRQPTAPVSSTRMASVS